MTEACFGESCRHLLEHGDVDGSYLRSKACLKVSFLENSESNCGSKQQSQVPDSIDDTLVAFRTPATGAPSAHRVAVGAALQCC